LFKMPACLTIKSPGNDPRVIQGLAVSIAALGGVAGEQGSKRRRYSLSIVPRLWLLRRGKRHRIFQNRSIPEIVTILLAGVGIKDADCYWRADPDAYAPLPFVYQRAESDWDFFRRILASAGIFFFYEHASGFLDGMFGGAAGAVAGAVGAAAGMFGGAVASAVGGVESAAGMVPVLNFGDAAGHTAAVANGLGGLAAGALQAGLGALGGAIGGVAGAAVSAVAGAVEEPSDTLAFDDDMGADADVERVYEFELKKTLRTRELRMLDRDVETAQSWVGVATVPDLSASLNLSAGVSVSAGLSLSGGLSGGGGLAGALSGGVSGALSAAAGVGASFDVDAPTIPASMLRQEVYQEDLAVWQDGLGPDAEPAVALSASLIA
ncbi:MAG: contractile injection system protein, VgrG/Pvc8 family, partial [Polyangiaceae bacterium]